MEYDKNKIDEYTLALLYLVTTWENKGARRAWKGFDWETMNRLHEKGFISDPRGKGKSVIMTEEGFQKAEELSRKFFEKKK
jgi:hypothetical protein